MKEVVYAVPLHNGRYGYIARFEYLPLRLALPISWFFPNQLLPHLSKPFGKYYVFSRFKDKPYELLVLSPSENLDRDEVKEFVKKALSDSLERFKRKYVDMLRVFAKFDISLITEHLFIRYWIPLQMMFFSALIYGFSYLSWVDFTVGAYLFAVRSPIVRSCTHKVFDEFFEEVRKGLDKALKKLKITVVKDERLKKLEKIVKEAENSMEAYIKAKNAIPTLGLPLEIAYYYRWNTSLEEEKLIKERGFPFWLKEKPRKPVKPLFKREVYKGSKERRVRVPEVHWLIDYKVGPKYINQLRSCRDIEEEMTKIAREVGAEVVTVWETKYGNVKVFVVGNKKGKHVVLVTKGHCDEPAGKYAILQCFKSLCEGGEVADSVLEKFSFHFMPFRDPVGEEMELWTVVDMEGDERHLPREYFFTEATRRALEISRGNPSNAYKILTLDMFATCHRANLVEKDGRIYRDENGVCGDEVVSDRIYAILEYIDKEVKPTIHVDFHETLGTTLTRLFTERCGLLSIEDWPLTVEDRKKVYQVMIEEPIFLDPRRLVNYIPGLRKLDAVKRILGKYPGYKLGRLAMKHVSKMGFKVLGGEHQKFLEAPALYPQIVAIDRGRAIDGPQLWPDIKVLPAVLSYKYGTMAFTLETFGNPIEERVMEHCAFFEGLIKAVTEVM